MANTLTAPASGEAPYLERKLVSMPIVAIATDAENPAFVATEAGIIQTVKYYPAGAKTGDNTNYRTLSLYNRGAANAGTALAATLALTTGVNLVANTGSALALSGTAANLVVAAGDVLTFSSVHTASGLSDPGGLLVIEIGRN